MDTQSTVDRLRALDDDPIGPPIVDVTAAMAVGRRRLRRRRTSQAVVAVAAIAAAILVVPLSIQLVRGLGQPAPTSPSLVCSESLLPAPSADQDALGAIDDPTGHYRLGVVTGPNGRQLVLWHDGVVRSTTKVAADIGVTQVNSHGVAIGGSTSQTTNRSTGFVYAAGILSTLAGPADFQAKDINNRNVIVGYENDALGHPAPIIWRTPTSKPKLLRLPDGWTGEADAVTDDGSIFGIGSPKSDADQDGGRGILWHPDGSYELIPVPTAVAPGVTAVRVRAIHGDSVDLIGLSSAGLPFPPPFLRYNVTTRAYTQLVATGSMDVTATNAAGWAAGWTVIHGADHAVVHAPGARSVTLPTLVKHTAHTHAQVETISDDGRLLTGTDTDASGATRAVTWTCDPS